MRRLRQLPATITFRIPNALDERLRDEAEQTDRKLGEVMREYLTAGVQTVDAQRSTSDSTGRGPTCSPATSNAS